MSVVLTYRNDTAVCGHDWQGSFWGGLPALNIDLFRPEGSDFRPRVQAKLAWDDAALAVCFRVEDRYLLSRNTEFMSMVCRDSCVEFFFKSAGADGYFNFEANIGGALHASYVRNPERDPQTRSFLDWEPLRPEDGALVAVSTSRPGVIDPELEQDTVWTLSMRIPFAALEPYCGAAAATREGWRCNLYKCADLTSHPHWASHFPLQRTTFHSPQWFGEMLFAPKQG